MVKDKVVLEIVDLVKWVGAAAADSDVDSDALSQLLYATGTDCDTHGLYIGRRSTPCHSAVATERQGCRGYGHSHRYGYGGGWLASRVVSVLDSGAVGLGFKSQSRRCRVTVLGKLFTPIVPLFTKQQNW